MIEANHPGPMTKADVVILGGGLVGLTLAVALDSGGLSSVVIDPADPAAQAGAAYDGRATAVASASWRMLEAIGVAGKLGAGCAIETIRVTDGLKPGGLTFHGEVDEPLGRMFENRALRAALRQVAEASANVTLMTPVTPTDVVRADHGVQVRLADGRVVAAPLLIAADGRNSATRAAANIRTAHWRYDHAAIIATVEHEQPHANTAYEIFYPSGPFAILPMLPSGPGAAHRSAIVWSVAARDAAAYFNLPDRIFADELEKRMGGFLGPLRIAAPRARYPLGFHHAATITGHRLALAGDAAHGIHPIAGQGLNLGFRDAAALAQVLAEGTRLGLDLGDAQLLARYQRWRSLDTFAIAAATDGLTRIFGMRGRAASALRRAGMNAIDRIAPLKSRLMDEARGTSGELPLLLRGLPI